MEHTCLQLAMLHAADLRTAAAADRLARSVRSSTPTATGRRRGWRLAPAAVTPWLKRPEGGALVLERAGWPSAG
jgi:hypothetical protein